MKLKILNLHSYISTIALIAAVALCIGSCTTSKKLSQTKTVDSVNSHKQSQTDSVAIQMQSKQLQRINTNQTTTSVQLSAPDSCGRQYIQTITTTRSNTSGEIQTERENKRTETNKKIDCSTSTYHADTTTNASSNGSAFALSTGTKIGAVSIVIILLIIVILYRYGKTRQ